VQATSSWTTRPFASRSDTLDMIVSITRPSRVTIWRSRPLTLPSLITRCSRPPPSSER